MLKFPSQDHINIYVDDDGFICFKSFGINNGGKVQLVQLSIGQFRAVIKNAKDLIDQADSLKGRK